MIVAEITSVGDALRQILGYFQVVWDTILSVINGIGLAIDSLIVSVPVTVKVFTFMPYIIITCLTATLLFYVIKFLIGRIA